MADTATLQPLSREHRRDLDPQDDRAILVQARERFTFAVERSREERRQQLAALEFRAGDHWPDALRTAHLAGHPERLTMVLDRLNPYIQQVINAYRRSPLGMRVRPKSGGASKQVADLLEGKLRDIEQQSEADIAYTVALDQACGQGEGYFRLLTEYDGPYSFQQDLRIRPIYNRFAVYLDPASVHPAGLDAEWGFVIDRWATSRFCQYYEVEPSSLTFVCGPEDPTWHTKTEVQVAEYYYKTYKRQTLVRLPDGRVLPTASLTDLDPTWPTRETSLPTVHWVTMAGNAVLERTTWLGTSIPIIRVEGSRLNVNGTDKRTGMVQAGMDAQSSLDFYATAEAETIALSPKAPYILAMDQIAEYKTLWEQANDATMPYLPYKPVAIGGQILPPPQRQQMEPPIQALSQAKMMAQDDLRACLGMYAAAMGEATQQRSGVAINAEKVESEGTTYGYAANLAWAIRALGTMCVEILPTLYSGPGDLRQVSPDGSAKTTPVNRPYQDEHGQTQQHLLGAGSYEVVVSSGPSYETSRMQVSDKLSGVLGTVQPDIQRYFLDTWAASLDFPGSEDLAQRLRTLVPPEALAASEQQDPRTHLVQLQNQVKQATEALQMMQAELAQSKQTEAVAVQQVALLEKALADMKVRLDNKAQAYQLDAQKAEIDFQLSRQANELKWRELELRYGLGQPNGALLPTNGTGA